MGGNSIRAALPASCTLFLMHGDDTLSRFERSERSSGGIEPLDSFVLIEPVDDESETTAGLIIPASAESACRSGVVVAVGDDVHGVAPGDKVLFPKEAGYDVRLAGTAQKLLKREDLIARILD
jgi:chaperonin GroES